MLVALQHRSVPTLAFQVRTITTRTRALTTSPLALQAISLLCIRSNTSVVPIPPGAFTARVAERSCRSTSRRTDTTSIARSYFHGWSKFKSANIYHDDSVASKDYLADTA